MTKRRNIFPSARLGIRLPDHYSGGPGHWTGSTGQPTGGKPGWRVYREQSLAISNWGGHQWRKSWAAYCARFPSANNKPYISHYNATTQDLHLTYPVDQNGNCGTNNDWYCEVVDSVGDVGQYSSIAIYDHGTASTRKTGIAYYDATNRALKTAIWSCPTIGPCGWNISTIQQGTIGVSDLGVLLLWCSTHWELLIFPITMGIHLAMMP